MIVFDIETEPLPDEQLRKVYTPPTEDELPRHPGEFDPAGVALGNIKDEAKKTEKIEAARAKHSAALDSFGADSLAARESHFAAFRENAALSATTGRVLAIGYYVIDKDRVAIDHLSDAESPNSERQLIAGFWNNYTKVFEKKAKLIGVNIHDFDLPFLIRRSWILGIDVPAGVIVNERYWSSVFVDLRRIWLLGQHQSSCSSSFDTIGKSLGTGGKNGDVNGGEFHSLWRAGGDARAKARAYLESDLRQPAEWARRMGIH